MVLCQCGKPMEKVPTWLEGVTVTFVCNNCPNRTVKSIAQISLEPARDPNQDAIDEMEIEVEAEDESEPEESEP
jgi:hypothetical protein